MRYYDPEGTRYGIPTYPYRLAPEGLATVRQLRVRGLRPGGQPVAAQLIWRRRDGLGVAYLYRVDLALPVRPMTPGRWRAHAAMMRARRTCPACRTVQPYVISTALGRCTPCADTAPAPAAA